MVSLYWKQFLFGVSMALLAVYFSLNEGMNPVLAIGIGLVTYVAIRAILTWLIRTKYWLHRDGHTAHSCPNCGNYIHRISGDWVRTCRRCGWQAGWPVIRWMTASVPAVQLRRTLRDPKLGIGLTAPQSPLSGRVKGTIRALFSIEFVLLALVIGSIIAIGGVAIGVIDSEQVPVEDFDNFSREEFDATEVEHLAHEEINEVRQEEGRSPMNSNDALRGVAQEHSRDMAEREFFAHENPDGGSPYDRVTNSQIACQAVGENIAQTYWREEILTKEGQERYTTNAEIAEGLVQQWMNSPPHRQNILDGQWTTTGIGIYRTADDEVFATQKFCR